MEKLIDLTRLIENGLAVFPGDEETRLDRVCSVKEHGFNRHYLRISAHAGTHIDAPLHFLDNGEYISGFPLDTFIGEGYVLDVRNEPVIRMKKEYEARITPRCILLLCTGKDTDFGSNSYFKENPVIDEPFARFIAEKRVKMIGLDSSSPDREPYAIHKIFFDSGIPIMENLTNLESLLSAGRFEVIAFPLKIKAEASILRVVARLIPAI